MGGLITTKGTRRLIKTFNNVFSDLTQFQPGQPYNPILVDLGPSASTIPPTGYPFLFQLSEKYAGTLYPPPNADHPNLLKRWKHFLRKELLSQCQSDIRDALYTALTDDDPSDPYNSVKFDAVIATSQFVIISDEYEDTTDGNEDNALGTKYMKVTLVTPATQAPYPLDDQTPE